MEPQKKPPSKTRRKSRYKIFISYSYKDKQLADKLALELENSGLSIWRAEENIYPGENWSLEIRKALYRADAIVILITQNSAGSKWAYNELEYALSSSRLKDRVIPVLYGRTVNMPWILKKFEPIQYDSMKEGETSKQIIRKLRKSEK